MGTPEAMLNAYAEIATRPSIVAVEALGLALLGWTVRKGRLHRRGSLKRLLLTGKMSAPIPQESKGGVEEVNTP